MENDVKAKALSIYHLYNYIVIPQEVGRGYPDHAVFPGDGTPAFFAEYKSLKTKGKLSKKQILTIRKLKAYGYEVYSVDENVDLKKIIEERRFRRESNVKF